MFQLGTLHHHSQTAEPETHSESVLLVTVRSPRVYTKSVQNNDMDQICFSAKKKEV